MELWSMVACGHLKTACCMQIWGDIFLSEINIWNDSFPQNIIIIWKKNQNILQFLKAQRNIPPDSWQETIIKLSRNLLPLWQSENVRLHVSACKDKDCTEKAARMKAG